MKNKIGIFDSGVGGLTVLEKLLSQINADYYYFADSNRAPWGSKSKEELWKIIKEISQFFQNINCDLIVTGCNTTYALFKEQLSEEFKTPVANIIETACEQAVNQTKSKNIGILATKRTIESQIYQSIIKNLSHDNINAYGIASPELVPLIESNSIESTITYNICERYIKQLLEKNIDTLIYGCTHYPYLDEVFSKIAPKINRINPADTIINKIKSLGTSTPGDSSVSIHVNGDRNQMQSFISNYTSLSNVHIHSALLKQK